MHDLNALPALRHNLTGILHLRNRSTVLTTYRHLYPKALVTPDWLSYLSRIDADFQCPISRFFISANFAFGGKTDMTATSGSNKKPPSTSPEGFPSRYQPPRPRLYGDVTTLPPNAAAGRLRFIVVVLGIFYRAGYSEVHPNKV